jgi:hypothetical protein
VLFAIIMNLTHTSILDDLVFIGGFDKLDKEPGTFFDLSAENISGGTVKFSLFQNPQTKAIIVFNSASQ